MTIHSRFQISGLAIEESGAGAIRRGALFSPDYRYRYVLWRVWGESVRRLIVVGLNPSTADAENDDPTVRRCVNFAKRELCGGLVMLNLFALRATDPQEVVANGVDAIGERNDHALVRYGAAPNAIVVAAWGDYGAHLERDRVVRQLLEERAGAPLHCLGHTIAGNPRHPLRLRGDTPLVALHRLEASV